MPTLRWNLPQYGESGAIDDIANLWNTAMQAVDDALTTMLTNPCAGLRTRLADNTVPADTTYREIALPTLVYALGGMTPTENGFRVPKHGVYNIQANVAYAPNGWGSRAVVVYINNEIQPTLATIIPASDAAHSVVVSLGMHVELQADDLVEIWSWQDADGSLNQPWARLGVALITELE
jgi:hypothetical protein